MEIDCDKTTFFTTSSKTRKRTASHPHSRSLSLTGIHLVTIGRVTVAFRQPSGKSNLTQGFGPNSKKTKIGNGKSIGCNPNLGNCNCGKSIFNFACAESLIHRRLDYSKNGILCYTEASFKIFLLSKSFFCILITGPCSM